MINCIIRWD